MTATLTQAVYGVRHRWPDEAAPHVYAYPDLVSAEEKLHDFGLRGLTCMEIVTWDGGAWQLAPEGLVADVRELADAHVDGEVDVRNVRDQLALWLPGRDLDEVLSSRWPELLEDIETHRRADDGEVDWAMVEPELRDSELYVQHLDGCVIDAVKRVIGNAA